MKAFLYPGAVGEAYNIYKALPYGISDNKYRVRFLWFATLLEQRIV